MNAATWQIEDGDPDDVVLPGQALPIMVSAHFIRLTLRRRSAAWLTSATAGLLLGAAFLLLVPAGSTAETSISLAHDAAATADSAMATDVSLAQTRAVALKAIDQLKLDQTPSEFLSNLTVVPVTNDVLMVSLKAPTKKDAERRLGVYTKSYLDFRAQQLTAQAVALSSGTQQRIQILNKQAKDLTAKIDRYTAQGGGTPSDGVAELISQRAQFLQQASGLQQSIDDANVKATSLVAASRVLDEAAVEPGGALKRIVLVLASGLIGGTALGVTYVLVTAMVSDKLHRRVEVATALEVPVTTSVAKIRPLPRGISRLPFVRIRSRARDSNLRRLSRAVEGALPPAEEGQWLVVGCVDNADEVALGVVMAAAEMQRSGRNVRLVDLTDGGAVKDAVKTVLGANSDVKLAISRPRIAPSLARDASDMDTYGPVTREIPALRETQVFLSIADLDPSVGAFHLTSWTSRVIVAVTAGQSSAERVRTATDLVRTAGLELWCGVLLHNESSDASIGIPLNIRDADSEHQTS